MSILTKEVVFENSEAQNVCKNLLHSTKSTYSQMVVAFNRGSELFWNSSPEVQQQVLDLLGADAKEVFELHGKLGALLLEISPDDVEKGVSVVGSFTYNEDGTISLN